MLQLSRERDSRPASVWCV